MQYEVKTVSASQAAMDEENPECFLDGLIQYQKREMQTEGEAKVFTDEVLGALVSITFLGGIPSK